MGTREDAPEKFRLNGIDKVVLLWAFTDAICASVQWGDLGRRGEPTRISL